jgi:tryptophan synthase alpha chain
MNASPLEQAFADEPAFVPYLAAGDPSPEATGEYVRALERGGADVIELGLPFSEPIAEGPTIQRAVVRALEGGMTPDRYFDLCADLDLGIPVVCMTYYNLLYSYGGETGPANFVARAAEAGVEGLVIPDLPAEEAGPLRAACDEHGLDLVFIVAPTTEGERLERIMSQVSGYVYVQARLGTTGARADVSEQTGASLARLKRWDVPKAVGFGISEFEHAKAVVEAGADGVIVGSTLVDIVAEGATAGSGTESRNAAESSADVETTADRLAAKARELKAGALAGAGIEVEKPETT